MHSHSFHYFKKILCTVLIIQLAFPPTVLMAMNPGDEDLLTAKLKALYKAQNTLPKLIEDASVPEQQMDDYYVKLQIVLNSKKATQEKLPINLSQMFEKVGDEDAAGKVLVTGVAGIGKTTFLNHITYKWSQGKVFTGAFNTILKIRLRSLLDDSLAMELSTEYSSENQLAALIQRSIEQQQQELKNIMNTESSLSSSLDSGTTSSSDVTAFSTFSLEEIKAVDMTKTLLLLDGYDEIEHLNRGGHVVRDLMRSIFEFPNVVLTSRPNAVTSILENRFERKIEAVGLGGDEVSQYIKRYFSYQSRDLLKEVERGLSQSRNLLQYYEKQEDPKSKEILANLEAIEKYCEEKHNRGLGKILQGIKESLENYYQDIQQSLSLLYRGNPILQETLTTPINLAMICLIATDPNILRRFEGEFNLGQLYEGVVVWLGKRYLTKFKEREARDTLDAIDIVDERILNLEELSVLEQAAYQEFKVNKEVVSGKKLDDLAREINLNLGIRQVNKYGLLKPEATRPSYNLVISLHGLPEDQDITPSKVYLYTDKESLFYATRKRGDVERVDLTATEGLSTAVKENIIASLNKKDRELKAGDKKAFFSVLSSKGYNVVEGPSNAKSVRKEALEAQDLINRTHRFVHLSFQEYLTAHKLKALLQQENDQGVEAVAQLIGEHRNEPRYLMTLKFLAGIVSKEEDESEGLGKTSTSSQPSTLLVERFWDAVTCNVDGVLELGLESKITLLMHLLAQSKRDGQFDPRNPHLPTLTKLLDEVILQDIAKWEKQIIHSGYLSEPIANHLNALFRGDWEESVQAGRTAIEVITSFINRSEFGGREAIFTQLMHLVKDKEDWQVKKLLIKKIEQIMDSTHSEASLKSALTTIIPLLQDNNFSSDVCDLLAKIIITAPDLLDNMFSLIIPLLKDSAKDIREVAFTSVGKVVAASPEMVSQVLSFLAPLLKDPDSNVRGDAVKSLGTVVQAAPKMASQVFSLLMPLLKDSEWSVRGNAVKSLGTVVQAAPKMASQVFSLLMPLLKDSEGYVRGEEVKSMGKMVKTGPDLVSQIRLEFQRESKSLARQITIESLVGVVKAVPETAPQVLSLLALLLKDIDVGVRNEAFKSLRELIKVMPEEGAQVFSLIKPLLKDSKWEIRIDAAANLREMVKIVPAVAPQILDLFVPLLNDSNWSVRSGVGKNLGEVMEMAPEVVPQVISLLDPLLEDSDETIRQVAAENLGKAVGAVPSVAPQILSLLKNLLMDPEGSVRNAAAKSFGKVVKMAPDMAPQVLSLLKLLSKNSSECVKEAVAWSLGMVVLEGPILTSQAFSLLELLLKASNEVVRNAAAESMRNVVRAAPAMASQVLSLLAPLLKDTAVGVKECAAESVRNVVSASATVASQALPLLEPLLKDSDEYIRKSAAKSLKEVVKAVPETAPQVLSLLALLLKDTGEGVGQAATWGLGEVVKADPAMSPQVFSHLVPLLKDPDKNLREAAFTSFGEVVKADPAMASQVLSLLEPLLEDSDWNFRHSAAKVLGDVAVVATTMAQDIINSLNASDLLSEDVAKTVFHRLPLAILASFLSQKWQRTEIRGVLEAVLLSKLKSVPVETLTHEQILPLLTIVDLTKGIDETKELNFASQKVLKQVAGTLDEAGIAWINAHFDQLPHLPERHSFLKDAYHTLLRGGNINEVGRGFIINCIQSGLTTTITRSGNIILDGVSYTLSLDNKPHLNTITHAPLSQQDDRLAEQYREYKPLFPNNKVGLRIAASDIEQVPSLVGIGSLMEKYWYLTLLTPEIILPASLSSFILIEKRDDFGDRVVHKLNIQGQAMEKRYVLHPDDTTRIFLESLFGPLSLSTYQSQSILLNEDQERELFSGILSSAALVTPLESSQTWNDFRTRLFAQSTRRFVTQSDLLGIDPASTEAQLVRHEKALQDGGVYDLATIRRGFHALQTLHPQLRNYAQTFYWTMANYFEAYRSISTGLFQTNTGAEITTKEQIGGQIAKKGAQYIAEVLKPVPVLGSAVALLDTLIDDIMGTVEQTRFENKVNAIMRIIREKYHLAQDISSTIAKVAFEGAAVKTQAILHPAPKVTDASMLGNFDRLKSVFEKKLSDLKDAILPTIELNDPEDPGVQLALKDVALTMAYLFKNHEEIIRNKEPLDIQMMEITHNGSLERLLSPPSSLPSMSNSSQQTTAVAPTAVNNNSKKGRALTPQSGKKTTCVIS